MYKYYRINEVAQLTSVSIRTLHYYDEIKLLCPSYRTEGSHRLYTKDDLMKLQQIMTLKFMGFTLKEIQNLLHTSNFNIHESLKIQAGILKNEAARIQKVSKLVDHLVNRMDSQEIIEWESIIKIIEILQLSKSDRQTWYEKYLNAEEQEEMKHLFSGFTDEFWVDYHNRWANLFAEVKHHLNTDPKSDIGIQLGNKWMNLVEEVYANKPKLRSKLWEGYKSGIIPENQLPYDQSIIAYITKACEKGSEQ